MKQYLKPILEIYQLNTKTDVLLLSGDDTIQDPYGSWEI